MKITPTVLAGVFAAALIPTAAQAQKPPKPPKPNPGAAALTLDAAPNPVVFGSNVTLSGKLSGVTPDANVLVKLEQDDTRPYGDKYTASTVVARTAANGRYSITLKPAKNTQYRVTAQAAPGVTSPARLVLVRPLVGLRVSTQSPRRGSLVRFSGIVQPARNGANVLIQRRTSTGGFLTVARTALRAATNGSAYSVRVRIRSTSSYRVKLAGTAEFVNGFSRTLRLTVR